MARLLEGKPLAEKIREDLRRRIASSGKKLTLASIQVGENPGVEAYVRQQKKAAESIGIEYRLHAFGRETGQEELGAFIQSLNQDICVNGIVLQAPLPRHIDFRAMSGLIAHQKDVEGMSPASLGRLVYGKNGLVPCTAASAMELIVSTGVALEGKEAVIVGHSEIVGKPLALLLMEKLATVTVCHIGTFQAGKLEEHVRRAQILVVAVGKAGLIRGEWVRENAIVIDVGINRTAQGLTGDVEFGEAEKRAAWITPVPGGVGPLTVTMLMRNLVDAYL